MIFQQGLCVTLIKSGYKDIFRDCFSAEAGHICFPIWISQVRSWSILYSLGWLQLLHLKCNPGFLLERKLLLVMQVRKLDIPLHVLILTHLSVASATAALCVWSKKTCKRKKKIQMLQKRTEKYFPKGTLNPGKMNEQEPPEFMWINFKTIVTDSIKRLKSLKCTVHVEVQNTVRGLRCAYFSGCMCIGLPNNTSEGEGIGGAGLRRDTPEFWMYFSDLRKAEKNSIIAKLHGRPYFLFLSYALES